MLFILVSTFFKRICKQNTLLHSDSWIIFISCTPDKEILDLTLGQEFLSYQGYPTQGKIKFENSHVFDMHWL